MSQILVKSVLAAVAAAAVADAEEFNGGGGGRRRELLRFHFLEIAMRGPGDWTSLFCRKIPICLQE